MTHPFNNSLIPMIPSRQEEVEEANPNESTYAGATFQPARGIRDRRLVQRHPLYDAPTTTITQHRILAGEEPSTFWDLETGSSCSSSSGSSSGSSSDSSSGIYLEPSPPPPPQVRCGDVRADCEALIARIDRLLDASYEK